MDPWKLLILTVIIAGLVLILGGPPELPKLPEGARIEEGTFKIVTPGGQREEIFGIYPVDLGFRVVSISHEAGKVVLEADFLCTKDWKPLVGTITQRSPTEMRWVYAFLEDGVEIRVQQGAHETVETLSVSGDVFPFDRDLLAFWDAFFRANVETAKLLEVRTKTVFNVAISAPEDVNLLVFSRPIPAERFSLSLGDELLRVYRQGDLLLGLRGDNFDAYLVEILPEGLREAP